MKARPRILFYFLHLLGVGHVYRAQRLIEGFSKHGFAVDVIYGGERLKDISFAAESVYYLSPIRAADNSYSTYLDAHDRPLERPFQDQRAREILAIFDTLDPDIVLTEAFPFGRRMVRHEMAALLEAVKLRQPRPLVVSSVRDILQERKKPGRLAETCDWIEQHFDHVLVHSDPHVIRLDSTFPLTDRIADKLSYTGFVIPPAEAVKTDSSFDVLVSAGGGAFGGDLMVGAMAAARQDPNRNWCLTTGPNLPEERFQELTSAQPSHVTVTRYFSNLAEQMKQSGVSISQCGYNTAMDALAAHRDSSCRAVFVPYDTEGQSEQLRRAQLLEESGYAVCLPQSQLTPQGLLEACDKARSLDRVAHAVNFDGVNESARLLLSFLEAR
jgi:predicted glycosyltransferase